MKYTVAVLAAIAAFATHPSTGLEPAKRVAQEATSAPEGVSECQETVIGSFKLSIIEGNDGKRNVSKTEVSLFIFGSERTDVASRRSYAHLPHLPCQSTQGVHAKH